jgi:peptide/nickel transport system ATP-binding protein/oligopeptide transport system ATP-binding protein
MTADMPLLEAVDLCKRFTKRSEQGWMDGSKAGGYKPAAVEQVTFHISKGEIYGLVGESGSGKSTIARLLMRLIDPESGRILLNGQDLTGMSQNDLLPTRRQIQIVFQDSLAALSPRRSIRQTLLEPLEWHRMENPEERGKRLEAVLETVGMDNTCLSRFPHELSGGQRQRICLARALILEPQLVIADEALSALDVSVQARVIALMRSLRDEKGVAFLLISHDLAVIRQLADRVGVLYRGQLVEEADADDLFNNPLHPYTRMLIQAVPTPDPTGTTHWPAPVASGQQPMRACLFSHRCADVKDVCTSVEPRVHQAATGSGTHPVKCHLYAAASQK